MSPAEVRDIANGIFSHFWEMPSSWRNCTTTLTLKWGQTDGVGADGLHQQFPFQYAFPIHACLILLLVVNVICLTRLNSIQKRDQKLFL